MRYVALFIFSLILSYPASADDYRLSVSTVNLKYFGLGGSPRGVPDDETRLYTIRDYLESEYLLTDVIAFQEIVDIEALKRTVLRNRYRCYTYYDRDPKHIHVVICVKSYLRFQRAMDDNNYALEDVGMDYYRPAVHGVVTTRSGRQLAHVVAVHLKAHPNFGATRAEQMNMIARYLRYRPENVPVVITGDFNTHAGDVSEFNEIFRWHRIGVRESLLTDRYTFRVPDTGYKFDRYWIDTRLSVVDAPKVMGPCNAMGGNSVNEIARFNAEVSDHCGVRVELEVH